MHGETSPEAPTKTTLGKGRPKRPGKQIDNNNNNNSNNNNNNNNNDE